MGGWLNRMTGFLNLWATRIVVLSSLGAHVVLILLAGIRRRKASGGRKLLLWLAYQIADWAATQALANLFLGSTSREQQLVAFWAPFLLLHLGRPDNISAYSLEDNVLSGRQVLSVAAQVGGAIYVLYRHIIIGSGGTLLPASFIMFFLGIAKYVERAVALCRGDLGSIRSSSKKQQPMSFSTDSEPALLVAHGLFHICKGAFADYPVDRVPVKRIYTRRKMFSYGWKEMCKVVEMEVSLMYDIMYTKAAVVHTWHGYAIRLASPPFTAAVLLLFCFHSKDGLRRADVVITYFLLVATFLLDVGWLVGALGLTWTYALFLKDRPRCAARWRGLRRLVASLDPCRWLLVKEPGSHRMWSGTIGQYNLLHECTRDTASLCSTLVKKIASVDSWIEYQYNYSRGLDISPGVREVLFERIWGSFKSAYPPDDGDMKKDGAYDKKAPEGYARIGRVDANLDVERRRELDEALGFGPEFQEAILVWHIATDVFLLHSPRTSTAARSSRHVKAIKAVSDYMVFLVAARPGMLPGLKLRSLLEATRDALQELWGYEGNKYNHPSSTAREENLANILRNMEKRQHQNRRPGKDRHKSVLYDSSIILSDGVQYAEVLLRRLSNQDWHAILRAVGMGKKSKERLLNLIPGLDECSLEDPMDMPKLLDLILDAWVHMIIYASVRCSRDSHAKQLSRGGEVTTIVWILAEHAGVFRKRRN